ncbi:MAG: type I DNA topoisomerase [Spirochaetales bacterium]|jgi:DNA topoisomerase-1|nr:type I DNA topoisomerase [Spirochaetales bacterium]
MMAEKKPHTLLIVESPAKAKTIEKYLGPGYTVMASIGHLIDLPKSRIAIDVEHNFEPEYITVRGKAKILKDLQSTAKKAGHVLLASDNDREGEAISYHLQNALLKKNPKLEIKRIVFNEITPTAIRDAVAHPGTIAMEKVNAQKARRVLDRIVGYNLSPVLWEKVKNGLSAGRVQSVALRLICEREKEVESFIPEEYWTLAVELLKGKSHFTAQMIRAGVKKAEAEAGGEDGPADRSDMKSRADIQNLMQRLENEVFTVTDIRETEKSLRPRPPFTTSQLQQTAANRLGFTSRKTMSIAQQLYEGVAIGANRIGLITYMRTDSTRISALALEEVRKFIGERYPGSLPAEPNSYSMGKSAQDAHEAIRPTIVTYTPESVKAHLTKDQERLYAIIWERFVSSQMTSAKTQTVSVDITAGDVLFRVSSTRTIEKGFQAALDVLASKESGKKLPALKVGEILTREKFLPEQHFTTGPARYTDATIVKTLEEKGIGRPSTYASTISVLIERYYVERRSRQLIPTQLGRTIYDLLINSFPDILDVNFTAGMESMLDRVESEGEDWVGMIRLFYGPFKQKVEHVSETLQSIKGVMDEPTEFVCEKCGRQMIKKLGRFGFFLACSGFPECRNTKSIPLADCPKPGCGGKIVARRKQKGRGKEFYGCTNYPECDFISHFKPTSSTCPKCGWFLVEKSDKKRGAYKACINKDCDYLHTAADDEEAVEEAGRKSEGAWT